MESKSALKVNDADNVATVFNLVSQGELVLVCDKKGKRFTVKSLNHIPYGHKIAIVKIGAEEYVKKYGEVIGRSTVDIEPGEHVHIHNIESCRGRGDLKGGY